MTSNPALISRREFLYLSLGVVASGMVSGCRLFSAQGGSPLEQALAALEPQAAQVVSKELVESDVRFGDQAYLVEQLRGLAQRTAESDGGKSPLLQAIVADFRAQRTINVSGWILSITEAQVIALKALDAGSEAR
jgi:hypothetical protein